VKIPQSIPDPGTVEDVNLRRILESMKINLETLYGERGTVREKQGLFVEDLKEAGIIGVDDDKRIYSTTTTASTTVENVTTGGNVSNEFSAVGTFDATGGKEPGTYNIGITLPVNAVLVYAWMDTIVGFDSAIPTSSRLGWGIEEDFPPAPGILYNGFIGPNVWWRDAGVQSPSITAPVNDSKTTAPRQMVITLSGPDLTEGKADLHIRYTVGSG